MSISETCNGCSSFVFLLSEKSGIPKLLSRIDDALLGNDGFNGSSFKSLGGKELSVWKFLGLLDLANDVVLIVDSGFSSVLSFTGIKSSGVSCEVGELLGGCGNFPGSCINSTLLCLGESLSLSLCFLKVDEIRLGLVKYLLFVLSLNCFFLGIECIKLSLIFKVSCLHVVEFCLFFS